jgi:ABC-2 type transport system permease protein
MTRLLSSELLRLRSRAAVMALLGGALMVVVALMVGQFITHEDDYAAARQHFRTERAAAYEGELAAFQNTLKGVGPGQLSPNARVVSREAYVDGLEFFGGRTAVQSKRFDTRVQMVEMAKVTSTIIALGAFLAGASFAGADWATRALHGLLSWESRRIRVLLAKVCVIAAAATVTVFLGQALAHGAGFLAGTMRGTTEGVGPEWWLSQGGAALRGGLLAAFAGALGFVLAFAARSTGFALGLALLYLGVVESLLLVWKPSLEPYTLRGASNAFLDGGHTILLQRLEGGPVGLVVPLAAASLTLAVYLAAPLVVTVGTFTRRDVL